MSIQELAQKLKSFLMDTEVLLSLLIIVVSCVSFYLGRVSMSEDSYLSVPTESNIVQHASVSGVVPVSEESKDTQLSIPSGYVASKNGSKYHLPWCGSAKQIKEENKVYFATKDDAERAGYTPAANCKGI